MTSDGSQTLSSVPFKLRKAVFSVRIFLNVLRITVSRACVTELNAK